MSRDDDEHDHVYGNGNVVRGPRAPQSSPTIVGLGTVETSLRIDTSRDVGEGPPTPPSGVPAVLARGDTSLIVERVLTVEEKVDALIADARDHQAKLDGVRRELQPLRAFWKRLSQTSAAQSYDLTALKGEVAELKGNVLAHAVEFNKLRKAIVEIDDAIGRPADNFTPPRVSQIKDMTSKELEEHDRAAREGTGLHRAVATIVTSVAPLIKQASEEAQAAKEAAEQTARESAAMAAESKASADKAVQKSGAVAGGLAVGGLTIVQVAQSLLQSGNERLVGGAFVVLVLVGLVEAARRRFWRK